MNSFLWWSGVVAWGALGIVGIFQFMDYVIELVVGGLWAKKEFLMFVADRLRAKRADGED